MKKILALGGSSSRKSINKSFAIWAAGQIPNADTTVLDLNDFEAPIYSVDRESDSGIPDVIAEFKSSLKTHDGIVLSLAEHNGAYSTAFKNVFDWTSRLEGKTWEDKPMFLLATSPGGRGGMTVLEIAKSSFPHNGGNVVASFSLPSFQNNFSEAEGITDSGLKPDFEQQLQLFIAAL